MKSETKHRIRQTGVFLFVFYMLLMMYLLFFSEGYGRTTHSDYLYHYNLVPFVEIRRFWIYRDQLGMKALFTNVFGNVLGFLPYGFIIPIIQQKLNGGFLVILSGLGLSLCVETIQLFTKVGCFDVDDLILNTAGAAIGYLAFIVCNNLRRKYYGKKI